MLGFKKGKERAREGERDWEVQGGKVECGCEMQ